LQFVVNAELGSVL